MTKKYRIHWAATLDQTLTLESTQLPQPIDMFWVMSGFC